MNDGQSVLESRAQYLRQQIAAYRYEVFGLWLDDRHRAHPHKPVRGQGSSVLVRVGTFPDIKRAGGHGVVERCVSHQHPLTEMDECFRAFVCGQSGR